MTDRNELDTLRMFAKRFARKHRVRRHNALDIVAMQQGHAHWNALMKAWNHGWCPAPWDLIDINEPMDFESPVRGPGSIKTIKGDIGGKPYTLEIGFDDVLIRGDGWTIYLDHAPSKPAGIETYKKPNPLDDKTFLSHAMKIATEAADGVREAIAKDWGPAAMQPDKEGRAKHPLFNGMLSAEWFCHHCDGKSTSAQVIANMWHCPKCNATPLDIQPSAWWKQVLAAD
jgi:hypothetical protein